MRLFFLFILWLVPLGIQPQEMRKWEQYLNEVMTAEDAESEEWQQTYDLLCDIEQHPIDINTATREQLEELPFLSAQQIEAIMEYKFHYGPMKSLAELQIIPELGPAQRRLLTYFIYIGEEDENKFPSLKSIVEHANHELIVSAKIPFHERKDDEKSYLGYPYRHWFRYQLQYGDYVKLGIVGAQDAGEPFFSGRNKYGYDYYSLYLQLKNLGRIETLVLGNYRLSMGMGLVANNSFALGKIAMLQNMGRNTNSLRAHSSRSEGYMQGAGTTINLGRGVRMTSFISYAPMDATLNEDGSARTIITSGYHRTETEMKKKHNLHILKTGGSMRYDANGYHLGLNLLYNHLDRRLSPAIQKLYAYYQPSGYDFINTSIDYSYTNHRWAICGEMATDGYGRIATINTISLNLNSGLKMMALQRYYSYQYASLDAQSFSDGGKIRNESGVYLGLSWQPSPKWQMMFYSDYAYFPWAKYQISQSSYSFDNLMQCMYTTDNWKLMARYRLKMKQKDNSSKNGLENLWEHRTRLTAEFTTLSGVCFRTQFDGGYCAIPESELGMMLSENVAYVYNWLRLNAGVGYFNTDSYDSRIYLYENGPLYTYSMSQFYGEGIRYWLMLRANVVRKLMLTAKIGVTDYFDRSSQTNLDIQVRWKI